MWLNCKSQEPSETPGVVVIMEGSVFFWKLVPSRVLKPVVITDGERGDGGH